MHTEDNSDNSTRDELQYRPEWTVTPEARYHFACGLTAYGSVQYVANQYFYNNDGTEKKELNDITIVNMKFSQVVADSGIEVYAGVENLLDEDYEESYGLPQPGRTIYAGLEYQF
jgi:outer membrane cobalamin receptor